MIPVNGFFEYGIAALLGAAVMVALAIWGLVAEGNREGSEEAEIPDYPLYKKAA